MTLLLLSVGLAMDAVAVSASTGVTLRQAERIRGAFRLGLTFGFFQAMMASLGWVAGAQLVERIEAWDHWVAFGLLVAIGGKMIWESLRRDHDETERDLGLVALLILGIATSIDSLAAGVTLPMLNVPLAVSVSAIGIVTAVLSFAAALAARKLGEAAGERLELIGGIVLIGIGVKILVEHL